jgi:hypothetical protein
MDATFDCAKITVTLPDSKPAMPLAYSSAPEVFRNALGATWSARTVKGIYAAPQLKNGFKIDFASDSGAEWTYDLPSTVADGSLFLQIDPTTGAVSACAAKGQC